MTRVLFVDDEAAFLDSLQNLLRRLRTGWDIRFAVGGQEALEELSRGPLDLIVSDLRMPGMDGAELLHLVSERAPATARIVLSGYADAEDMDRAIPVAQQLLSKPCPAAILRRVVGCVAELQRALGRPSMQARLGRAGCLPALPGTEERLGTALRDRAIRSATLGGIVQEDPALAARVLQLANSALRPGEPVTSIVQAVDRLGVDLTGRLPAALRGAAPGDDDRTREVLGPIVARSVAVARLAAAFAPPGEEAELAYTAGLLHRIGWVSLAREATEEMAELARRIDAGGRPVGEIEREALGVTRAELGGYLLGLWGLPEPVVDAVAGHQAIGGEPSAAVPTAALVHAADVLLSQALAARAGTGTAEELDVAALLALGLAPQLTRWRALAAAAADAIPAP